MTLYRPLLSVAALLALLPTGAAQGQDVTDRVKMYWQFGTGTIEIDLYGNESPLHVANFLQYVDAGLYDFSYSHRTNTDPVSGSGAQFIQGGSFYTPPSFSPGQLDDFGVPSFDPVANEYDPSEGGLRNSPGTLAAARTADPDSATSGWFFNVTDNSSAFTGYTVFGSVSKGWDVFSLLPAQPWANEIYPGQVSPVVGTTPLFNYGTAENPNYQPFTFFAWVRDPLIEGDFNLDGVVDLADHQAWLDGRGDFNEANLTADANDDAVVDADDLRVWQAEAGIVLGDLNGDEQLTNGDIAGFVQALTDPEAFAADNPGIDPAIFGDFSGDGALTNGDIAGFVEALTGSGVAVTAVPEPGAGVLLGLGALMLVRRRRG